MNQQQKAAINNNDPGQSLNAPVRSMIASAESLSGITASYQALLSAIPDLVLRMNWQGIYTDYRPPQHCKLLVERNCLGKSVFEVLSPELARQRMFYIQQALETKELQVFEYEQWVAGSVYVQEARVMAIGADEVVIIVRDITKHKQVEQELQEAEDRYRSLFENAIQGIFQTNLAGQFLLANQMMARLLGYASPQELQSNIQDIGRQVYVDPQRRREFMDLMQQHSILRGFESQVYRKDGTIIWISEDVHTVYDSTGQLCGYEGTVENVTLRKQAEQIEKSAELLQLVLNNIPQYIFWKDRQSTYLGCNQIFAELVGINTPNNIIGKTDYMLPIMAEQAEQNLECERRVMTYNQPELRVITQQTLGDGKLAWVEYSRVPVHNSQGQVIGILGTMENVTDRQLAEQVLRESEAWFRKLAQQEELLNRLSSQIRNSLDIDMVLSTAVSEIRQVLQIDLCTFTWYHPPVDSAGSGESAEPPLTGAAFETICEARSPELVDSPITLPVDRHQPLHHSDPLVVGVNTMQPQKIDDISNHAHLSEDSRKLLQQAGIMAELIIPLQTRSGQIGLISCIHYRDSRTWVNEEVELLQAIASQCAIAIDQAELYAQMRQTADSAQAQAHQLEQTLYELQKTQAHLIQTEKMSGLGQLVAGVAHEINNPVNFIYGNLSHATNYVCGLLELVRLYQQTYPVPSAAIAAKVDDIDLDFIAEDLPRLLNSMEVGAERIRSIVRSLRNFSRHDESDMKLVDLHEGIDSTLLILQNRLKGSAAQAPIRIVKHYGHLPLVECYAGQLNQVFMNILSNGIDAIEQETNPCITIETMLLEDPSGSQNVLIRIQDNGPGIPIEIRDRLFDPFFTTKPVGQGTGLGLSISYQIVVERHRGSLQCTSEPGQGAAFSIQIPVKQLTDRV